MNDWYAAWLKPDCPVGANTDTRKLMMAGDPLPDKYKRRIGRECMTAGEFERAQQLDAASVTARNGSVQGRSGDAPQQRGQSVAPAIPEGRRPEINSIVAEVARLTSRVPEPARSTSRVPEPARSTSRVPEPARSTSRPPSAEPIVIQEVRRAIERAMATNRTDVAGPSVWGADPAPMTAHMRRQTEHMFGRLLFDLRSDVTGALRDKNEPLLRDIEDRIAKLLVTSGYLMRDTTFGKFETLAEKTRSPNVARSTGRASSVAEVARSTGRASEVAEVARPTGRASAVAEVARPTGRASKADARSLVILQEVQQAIERAMVINRTDVAGPSVFEPVASARMNPELRKQTDQSFAGLYRYFVDRYANADEAEDEDDLADVRARIMELLGKSGHLMRSRTREKFEDLAQKYNYGYESVAGSDPSISSGTDRS